jgi:arylsulfatase A
VVGKSGYRSRVDKKWEEKHGYPKVESKTPKLFNLKKDMGQRNDIAGQHPGKVKAMQAAMMKIRGQGYSAPRLAR